MMAYGSTPCFFCFPWFESLHGRYNAVKRRKICQTRSNIAVIYPGGSWLVGTHSALASISVSSTDLKSIQTPHSLFRDFGAGKTIKTRWTGGRNQVWVQVRASACHLAITPEGYSRRQSKVLTAKSRPRCGGALRHSLGGSDGQAQTQGICKLAAVAAGLIQDKVLRLLRFWFSSRFRVKGFWCFVIFGPWRATLSFV